MKDILFFTVMAASSAFGLIKTLLLASILDPSDFGFYLTLIGVSFYITYFISFGDVEKTYSRFPELVTMNDVDALKNSVNKCLRSISFRTIIFFALLLFLKITILDLDRIYLYAVPIYSATAVIFSLIASILRAKSKYFALSSMNFFRSTLFVLIILTSKTDFTLVQIINIEISVVVFVSSAFLLFEYLKTFRNSITVERHYVDKNKKDGLLIALSTIFLGLPLYLDRLYITKYYSIDDLKTYSLIAVIWSVSILIFNTIGQRTGAPLVVMTRDKSIPKKNIIKYVLRWWLLGYVSWLIFLSVFYYVYSSGLIPQWQLYDISNTYFMLIAILGSISMNVFLEFILIGLRKEKALLKVAVTYISILSAALILVHGNFNVQLAHFLIAMIISRVIYNLNLLVIFMRSEQN